MINNNNNFSGIGSMSASVYYGDGQYLTGVSGGATGSNGTSGTSGINGTSGITGATGSNGTSGTSGINGTSGITGATGSNGTSGTSGINGTSGTSGINGTSGITGATGSNGSGGGTSSATMFNSITSPADYGTLPWYKLNLPIQSTTTTTFTLTNIGEISYSTVNLVQGQIINEVAVYCSATTTAGTASIALYSIGLDANGRHYPSTFLTTFGDVSLATTGRKTITGLSYTIPSSPSSGIYYTAILRTGATGSGGLACPASTASLIYYASLDSSIITRAITAKSLGIFSSFPATITSASFSTYTNSTTLPLIGFR